jgi:hypothetical protein
MICARPVPNCPQCGEVLIHQTNRGPDESSSSFGQFVHEKVGRVMYWSDIDGVIYKKKTKVLRIMEHKRRSESLSDGQKEILPLLAKSIQLLAATRLIHEQSGVFVVHSDHPHKTGLIKQIRGWPLRAVWLDREMSGQDLLGFIQGEVVDIDDLQVERLMGGLKQRTGSPANTTVPSNVNFKLKG